MSAEDSLMTALVYIVVIGLILCCFFWISSCQRTEIIVACLNNTKDKAACVKEMP